MENENKKIILAAYVIAAAITHFVVLVLFQSLAVSFGAVGRIWSNETYQHALPLASAVAMFCYLQFNSKIQPWADEVVTEIKKVVWPSRKDTTAMTIVCCIMLIVAGIVLGLFDLISSSAVKWFVTL